ncbi:hypothetical protein ARMGADRAFT_27768 [Armillaria gallica]|uniref:Uncharacterized protein n=1 Tax=Armillaria gallica TaxID=47427 RepID=A0A2H3EM29_ARMGA|nr:hypothetical protein ARMGADRAFT_27768 [Armillaria gallica]
MTPSIVILMCLSWQEYIFPPPSPLLITSLCWHGWLVHGLTVSFDHGIHSFHDLTLSFHSHFNHSLIPGHPIPSHPIHTCVFTVVYKYY